MVPRSSSSAAIDPTGLSLIERGLRPEYNFGLRDQLRDLGGGRQNP